MPERRSCIRRPAFTKKVRRSRMALRTKWRLMFRSLATCSTLGYFPDDDFGRHRGIPSPRRAYEWVLLSGIIVLQMMSTISVL